MIEKLSRRGFIGWAATGAAGLLLPTIARPRPKVFDMGRGTQGRGTQVRGVIYYVSTGTCRISLEYGYEGPDGRTLWSREGTTGILRHSGTIRIPDSSRTKILIAPVPT